MSEGKKLLKSTSYTSAGFVACYKGKQIASAMSLHELANRAKVKELMGKKDLVIKHNVPEDMIVVY